MVHETGKRTEVLQRHGVVNPPTLEDGPEDAKCEFQDMQRLLDLTGEVLVNLTKHHTATKVALYALGPHCRCPQESCDRTERQRLQLLLVRIEGARRTAQVRFDQIRTVQKGLRTMARMMETVYAQSSSDVWLQRQARDRDTRRSGGRGDR